MRSLIVCAVCALMPVTASANGFLTRDLGSGGPYQDCLDRAVQSLQIYADRTNARQAELDQGSWAAYAFGMPPGSVDVQIACPYRNNISEIVLLTTHSTGGPHDRETVLSNIAEIWESLEGGAMPPMGGTK
ncbi:MAG: hypothetical protein JJU19_11215 [Pararhodobacter sp.]|nr:hypothetical protein [Pararhodobacter sp.]